MECAYFDAGLCRSCTLLPVPMDRRIAEAEAGVRDLLAPFGAESGVRWLTPARGPEVGFRNKAKMVVSGSASEPVLGILDEEARGVDLSDCPLYPPEITALLRDLPALIRRAQVAPYDVARRRGELKHVLVTAAPSGELMLRFVLRTAGPVPRLAEHLGLLGAHRLAVVTANIQPEHSAVIEGAEEIPIAGDAELTVVQGDVPLRVRPQSFLQTNTEVASQLYRQVAAWVDEAALRRERSAESAGADADPSPEDQASAAEPGEQASADLRVWDLYCGVGGFALHCAGPDRTVTGVEVSEAATASAAVTAAELGLTAEFIAADALAWAQDQPVGARPDVLIVNPPRRGTGRRFARWAQASGIEEIVYSSCNPRTLASDLAAMPAYRIADARLLDMFPHTAHSEVVVRLRRVAH